MEYEAFNSSVWMSKCAHDIMFWPGYGSVEWRCVLIFHELISEAIRFLDQEANKGSTQWGLSVDDVCIRHKSFSGRYR